MTDERGDEVLERVVDELRALPQVDDRAVARIVARARVTPQDAADDSSDADVDGVAVRPVREAAPGWRARRPRLSLGSAAAMALAAGLVGFLVRGELPERDAPQPRVAVESPAPAAPTQGATTAQLAAAGDASSAPRPTEFVLYAPDAKQVALVGDFNGWTPDSTTLVRDPATGFWSVSVPLAPGRHVYTFLVDGVRTTDPRAPKAHDAALGVTTSVTIVGATGGM